MLWLDALISLHQVQQLVTPASPSPTGSMADCGWAEQGRRPLLRLFAWCSEKAATTLWWQECGWANPEVMSVEELTLPLVCHEVVLMQR